MLLFSIKIIGGTFRQFVQFSEDNGKKDTNFALNGTFFKDLLKELLIQG
jgi:hypothetical protein